MKHQLIMRKGATLLEFKTLLCMGGSRDNPPKAGKCLLAQPNGGYEGVPISQGICTSKEDGCSEPERTTCNVRPRSLEACMSLRNTTPHPTPHPTMWPGEHLSDVDTFIVLVQFNCA